MRLRFCRGDPELFMLFQKVLLSVLGQLMHCSALWLFQAPIHPTPRLSIRHTVPVHRTIPASAQSHSCSTRLPQHQHDLCERPASSLVSPQELRLADTHPFRRETLPFSSRGCRWSKDEASPRTHWKARPLERDCASQRTSSSRRRDVRYCCARNGLLRCSVTFLLLRVYVQGCLHSRLGWLNRQRRCRSWS